MNIKDVMKCIQLVIIIVLICTVLCGCIATSMKVSIYEKRLESDSVEKRLETVNKLAKLEDEEVLDVLTHVLKNDIDESVRLASINAIVQRNDEKKNDSLKIALNDESVDIRFVALNTIIQMNDEIIIDSLKISLSDPNADIRLIATKKLGEFSTVASVDALINTLLDEDSLVQQEAVESLTTASQSHEAFLKVAELLADREKRDYRDIAIEVIKTNIENNAVDFDTILIAAYSEYDYTRDIRKIQDILKEKILIDEDLLERIFINFLNDNETIFKSSVSLFIELCDKDMEAEAVSSFIDLYHLADYDDYSKYPERIGKAIQKLYTIKSELLPTITKEMRISDETISKRIEESLVYSYFDEDIRHPEFYDSFFQDELSTISQQNKDLIMSLSYAYNLDTELDPLERIKQGSHIWDGMDKSKSFVDSLLESLKHGYDADATDKGGAAGFLVLLAQYHLPEVQAAIFTEFDKHVKTDITYAEYLIDTAVDANAEAYLADFFDLEIENLRKRYKNPTLEDGHHGAIIITDRTFNKNMSTIVEGMYKYWDIPFYSRAYTLSQVRYVVSIEITSSYLGYYQGTDPRIAACRENARVRVIDKLKGEELSSKTFYGESPPRVITNLAYATGYLDWDIIDEYVMEQIEKYTAID